MKNIIVCDLDGTLADCEHRVHHVQNKPKNWDAFYADAIDDTVNEAVVAVLDSFTALSHSWPHLRYEIIFCSGRPERCREDTEWWLKEVAHVWKAHSTQLFMRKDGDFRADHIVKQEILDAHIDKDRVLFVLDDRQQVVDMWRSNGLTCLQVAPGNF